jgi:hypothetical protein
VNDPALDRGGCRLRPVLNAQLAEDVLHVIFDGVVGDPQRISELIPLNQLQHLHFACAQIGTRHLRRQRRRHAPGGPARSCDRTRYRRTERKRFDHDAPRGCAKAAANPMSGSRRLPYSPGTGALPDDAPPNDCSAR